MSCHDILRWSKYIKTKGPWNENSEIMYRTIGFTHTDKTKNSFKNKLEHLPGFHISEQYETEL